MTLHGVPKPGWRAFQLLHSHAGSHTVPTVVTHGAGQSTGGNESLVAATSTVNVSANTESAISGTGRVFLSHWDGTHDAYSHATAIVTLEVTGVPATISSTVTVHMVDNTTSANLLWQSWGSPSVPTSAQLAELKEYSEVVPRLVPLEGEITNAGELVMKTTIVLPPNSACVVEV
eukprot:SAG31_NODE_14923_length_780_cov_1.469897_1_plen_175_part_00